VTPEAFNEARDMKKAKQPTPREIACRANGRKGGLARAKKLSASRRKEIASKAGMQTIKNHTADYFSFISKKRKVVGRYRTPVGETRLNRRRAKA
jgi:hypothetical protein